MTEKQKQEFIDFMFEIKHNRDYYSRAKIIEMIEAKFLQLSEVKNIVNEAMLSVVSLPVKSKVDKIITGDYKDFYGTNYDDNSLENAKKGGLIIVNWLLNNR